MDCPWCTWTSSPRALHAHLVGAHPEEVRFEEGERSWSYVVVCPVCAASHVQPIKPRSRDPGFIGEYEHEVRLVAFDMLVHHLLAEHDDAST